MIWHIFGKDCRQLWRLAATVACAHMANATLRLGLGPFNQPRGLVTFTELFSAATLLGMCALIVAAVQEDVIPGASQDWLIRPIRRRDLLVAKLMFVAVVVQGPALFADMAHGIAAGLAVGDSVRWVGRSETDPVRRSESDPPGGAFILCGSAAMTVRLAPPSAFC